MIRITAAAASLLLCAALLVACGDAGSDASTTKTATVPSGKLGGAFDNGDHTQYRSCMDAISSGGVPNKLISQFSVRPPLSCDVATKALASYLFKGKADGWDCYRMPGSAAKGTVMYTTCERETRIRQDFVFVMASDA